MPETKGKCPKEQRDGGHTKGWILILIDERCVLVLLCRRPISRQKKERSEAKFKKFKKPNTSLKRDTPRQNLSLQNDSNTRARIKQQQEQQRRGRSFERARTVILVFFRRGGGAEKTDLLFIFFCKILRRKSCRREEVSEIVARDLTSSRKRRRPWI